MNYFLSQIRERHGDFTHETLFRIKVESLEKATQVQTHWAARWYPFDNDELFAECAAGEYLYHDGSVAVSGGFCREISESTFMELEGIISEMSFMGGDH